MEIEIVVVPDCPNEQLATDRLRQVMAETGLTTTTVTTRVIADQAQAEGSGFTGSPTILIDGQDPFAEPGATPSLSCRIYHTPDGPTGAPEVVRLRRVLEAAAAGD